MTYLNEATVLNTVGSTNGGIFTVKFDKRTTGERRSMTCRLGVKAHLRGGELKVSPKDKKLIIVFDMQKQGYRSFPIDAVVSITHAGNTLSA